LIVATFRVRLLTPVEIRQVVILATLAVVVIERSNAKGNLHFAY